MTVTVASTIFGSMIEFFINRNDILFLNRWKFFSIRSLTTFSSKMLKLYFPRSHLKINSKIVSKMNRERKKKHYEVPFHPSEALSRMKCAFVNRIFHLRCIDGIITGQYGRHIIHINSNSMPETINIHCFLLFKKTQNTKWC